MELEVHIVVVVLEMSFEEHLAVGFGVHSEENFRSPKSKKRNHNNGFKKETNRTNTVRVRSAHVRTTLAQSYKNYPTHLKWVQSHRAE